MHKGYRRPWQLNIERNQFPSPVWKQADTEYPRGLSRSAVQAPDGDEVARMTDVTIDPYKARIEILRLHGKGLPLFGARGRGGLDLHVEVKIPQRLTARACPVRKAARDGPFAPVGTT